MEMTASYADIMHFQGTHAVFLSFRCLYTQLARPRHSVSKSDLYVPYFLYNLISYLQMTSQSLMRVDNVSVYQLLAFVLLLVLLSSWLLSNISNIQFISRRFFPGKQNTVLLVGPANAGKTALLHFLRHGVDVATVTSMKENDCSISLHSTLKTTPDTKQLHIIDFPGHERLRKYVCIGIPTTSNIL